METTDRISFSKFIEHIASNREVSLAIVPDDNALMEFGELTEDLGFSRCHDAFEVARKLQDDNFLIYIQLTGECPKPLYDLVAQYPLTIVQLQDPATMERIVVHPLFKENAILILATKKALSDTQTKGFNLLQRTGLCWQPPPKE